MPISAEVDLPTLDDASQFLEDGEEFLVTSHINSDGDGVGGCLALAGLLRSVGKRASILLHDLPTAYDFLDGWDSLQEVQKSSPSAERLIVVDCPTLERIGDVQNCVTAQTRILNIDHHKDNQLFGTTNLMSPEVSSCCELVYHLAVGSKLSIDRSVAEQLYSGILFDTGGFRFSLTSATTFEVAAALVRHGARLDHIADQLFGNKRFSSVKLIGRGVDSLELHCDDRVATLLLSEEDLRDGEVEEVVNYGLLVKGVEVALLLKEQGPEQYRISLRSRDNVDVSTIAAEFGGGGHAKASGCNVQGSADRVKETLLKQVKKQLD